MEVAPKETKKKQSIGSHPLHDDTLGAAAGLSLAAIHIHLLGGVVTRVVAAARRVALHLAVVSADLTNEIVKGLVNVEAGLG